MSRFVDLQLSVQAIMEAGRPIDDAEEVINDEANSLSDDERAALWLWAWTLLPQHRQRSEALRYLDVVDFVTYD